MSMCVNSFLGEGNELPKATPPQAAGEFRRKDLERPPKTWTHRPGPGPTRLLFPTAFTAGLHALHGFGLSKPKCRGRVPALLLALRGAGPPETEIRQNGHFPLRGSPDEPELAANVKNSRSL